MANKHSRPGDRVRAYAALAATNAARREAGTVEIRGVPAFQTIGTREWQGSIRRGSHAPAGRVLGEVEITRGTATANVVF